MHNLYNYKKYYFIDKFIPEQLIKLNKNISLIWRNNNNNSEIFKLVNFCKKNKRDLYLANNYKLAVRFNVKGVYISAKNYNLFYAQNPKRLRIIGSAHNLKEIQIKKMQRVKELFLAPVFKKKTSAPLGIYKLKHLFEIFKEDKIALGGVNFQNIKLLKLVNFKGFAGISYFE